MNKWLIIGFILIAVIAGGCSNEPPEPVEADYTGIQYFPLDTVLIRYYDVVEIVIDKPVSRYDTLRYRLKETYTGSFTDNTGHTAYIAERSICPEGNSNFEISDVWTAQIYEQAAFAVEENLRFVKIRFPVSEGKSWNGNLFNTSAEKTYFITNPNRSFTVNGMIFDSTLTVMHEADSSLIHKNYSREVYASHIGLIYKQQININSQEVIPQIPVDDRITTGTIYYQILTGYTYNLED
ncbi:MAG TPA: hypothetical protein PLZ52_05305 [Bacteroidales bacterium]|nr:hypothetical protein [Bacteroidales bacterium]